MDLDSDGHVDLISGSWPGEIFVFRGGPGRTFAKPEMLRDKDGEVINVGGGVRETDDMLLITGHAEWEKTKDGKSVVKYRGKVIEAPEGKSLATTGCASAVFAADWDGDGDLDILCGDIGGSVWLIPNEGSKTKSAFGKSAKLTAGGKPILVSGDAGPTVADWDGDGVADLVVGGGDGAVVWFRNTGSKTEPKLAAAATLVPPGKVSYDGDAPKEPRRGSRAKVCVADWNGDGKPDLLVGDFATQKPDRPDPTPEEKATQDKLRKELQAAQERFSELIRKRQEMAKEKDKAKKDKYDKDLREASEATRKLYDKLPPEYENHGWVWLFVRTPVEKAAGR